MTTQDMQVMQQQMAAMMQRLQMMEGTVQSLMNENANLRTQVEGSSTGLQQAFVQQSVVLGELAEGIKKLADKQQAAMLVDSRGLGKPSTFNNNEDNFPAWVRKTENYICGVFGEEFRKVLEWAIEHEGEIQTDEVEDTWGETADENDKIENLTRKIEQVYTALASLTEGESNDLVVGAGGGNGLEAWRKLGHRWDPAVAGRRRALLKAIINPPRALLNELVGCWERWEDMIRRYERRKDSTGHRTKLDEETKMSAFEMLIPEDIENHLMLNRKRLNTYELQKEEVNMILETRIGAKIKEPNLKKSIHSKGNPDAMDVDAFGKGGKGKWGAKPSKPNFTEKSAKGNGKGNKGKGGKGKAQSSTTRFEGTCDNCGKYGHKKADCWSKQQNSNSSHANTAGVKGNGKKGAERDKGKGKGNYKGARSFENANEPDAEVGEIEVNAVTQNTQYFNLDADEVNPLATALVGNNGGDEWLKLNIDTGAAVTVFPESLAPEGLQGSGQNYKTATGELTPDKGQVVIRGVTENNRRMKLTARVASVHKPLLSASRCVKSGQCVWLSKGGGWMIQDTDAAAKEVEQLLWRHAARGKATFVPIYEERGVYNIYMKKDGVVQEATGPGGDIKALTKPLKDCTKEELEQQLLKLRSGFPRQPCA